MYQLLSSKMELSPQDIQYYNIYEDNSPEFFAFSNALRNSIMDDMRGAVEGPKQTKLTWNEVSAWTTEQFENHVIAREIMAEQNKLRKTKEFSFMNYFGVRLTSSAKEQDHKKFRENDVDFVPYLPDSIENGVRMQRWRLVVENGPVTPSSSSSFSAGELVYEEPSSSSSSIPGRAVCSLRPPIQPSIPTEFAETEESLSAVHSPSSSSIKETSSQQSPLTIPAIMFSFLSAIGGNKSNGTSLNSSQKSTTSPDDKVQIEAHKRQIERQQWEQRQQEEEQRRIYQEKIRQEEEMEKQKQEMIRQHERDIIEAKRREEENQKYIQELLDAKRRDEEKQQQLQELLEQRQKEEEANQIKYYQELKRQRDEQEQIQREQVQQQRSLEQQRMEEENKQREANRLNPAEEAGLLQELQRELLAKLPPLPPGGKTVWGPVLWKEFHAWALSPRSTTKNYFLNFTSKIPCPECAAHYRNLLWHYPVPTDDKSLFAWSVFIHNQVNRRLYKPTYTDRSAFQSLLRNSTLEQSLNTPSQSSYSEIDQQQQPHQQPHHGSSSTPNSPQHYITSAFDTPSRTPNRSQIRDFTPTPYVPQNTPVATMNSPYNGYGSPGSSGYGTPGYGYQASPGPNIYGQYPNGYQQPYYGAAGSRSWW